MNLEKNNLFQYKGICLYFFEVLNKNQNRSSMGRAHIFYFAQGLQNVRNDTAHLIYLILSISQRTQILI